MVRLRIREVNCQGYMAEVCLIIVTHNWEHSVQISSVIHSTVPIQNLGYAYRHWHMYSLETNNMYAYSREGVHDHTTVTYQLHHKESVTSYRCSI